MPLLRVLVREVRNITQKTERKYGQGDRDDDAASTFQRKSQGVGSSRRASMVVITGGRPVEDPEKDNQWKLLALNFGHLPGLGITFGKGNGSDGVEAKALEAGVGPTHSRRASGRILQTQEVTVQYHSTRKESRNKNALRATTGGGYENMV